jgi:NADPH:quinone reductase-like Zn-dependent oxidoreductase
MWYWSSEVNMVIDVLMSSSDWISIFICVIAAVERKQSLSCCACRLPPSVELATAAGLFVQGMTAHYLAKSVYALSPKTACLVHAGGGGTGGLLIQLAKMLGAKVVATAGSMYKAEKALAHGADRILLCECLLRCVHAI